MNPATNIRPVRRVTPMSGLLLAVAVGVLAVGAWIVATQGLGMLWFFADAVTAATVLFVVMPRAAALGHRTEGIVAVWLALFFGPLALVVLIPWARGLEARASSPG
jgi:hypothetical protein